MGSARRWKWPCLLWDVKSNYSALTHVAAIDKIKVGHLKQVPTSINDWCERRDSNSYVLRRWYLKPVRLPIPPLSHLSRPKKRKRA